MHSQERKAPQLHDVALGCGERAQWHRLVAVVVLPAPDFAPQLGPILMDSGPKLRVGFLHFAVCILATKF